jgi:hypothetical protein
VFSTPNQGVVRIGSDIFSAGGAPAGRPNVPEMLQPVRSVNVGPFQVEHMNRVTPLDSHRDHHRAGVRPTWNEAGVHAAGVVENLMGSVESKGLNPWDGGLGMLRNAGVTDQGHGLYIDGGALRTGDDFTVPGAAPEPHVYRPPPLEYPPQGQVEELLRMGADSAVRDAISRGLDTRAAGQGVPMESARKYLEAIESLRSSSPVTRGGPAGSPPELQQLMRSLLGFGEGRLLDFQGTTPELSLAGSLPAPASHFPSASPETGGIESRFRDLLRDTTLKTNAAADVPGNVHGAYSPSARTAWQFAGSPSPAQTRRHELGHAAASNALASGARSIAGLPLAWQPGAWSKYAGAPNLGRYLDELGQTATQVRGSGTEKLLSALGLAVDPNRMSQYADHIAGSSPALHALMNAPPALWKNRVPIGVGVLSSNELASLAQLLSGGQDQ